MIHSLTMFLATEDADAQATPVSPPAPAGTARRRRLQGESFRFMASVIGNTAGFGVLLAGCWFSLQLIQLALP